MKKHLAVLILILSFTGVHADNKLLTDGTTNDGTQHFNNETLESCYDKTVSAVIMNCLIYLADVKQETYAITFNQFLEKVNQKKRYFFDYNVFVKLVKQAKVDWDKHIENECLAEATTLEKGGFGYNNLYNQCLVKGYESRIKYYENYEF